MSKNPKNKVKKPEVSLDDVVFALNQLNGKIDKLVYPISQVIQVRTPDTSILVNADTPVVSSADTFPVPLEYRNLVDTILNKKFGIEIDYLSDSASFNFSILVPKEYSNAGPSHWDTYKEDRRSKVILNALGANGVREWATKVYENFPPEIQSQITYQRSLP